MRPLRREWEEIQKEVRTLKQEADGLRRIMKLPLAARSREMLLGFLNMLDDLVAFKSDSSVIDLLDRILERSGYADLAGELRRRTLDMIGRREDIYEYYHPETGEEPPKAASTFGWSAAIFIDLAIQEARRQQ